MDRFRRTLAVAVVVVVLAGLGLSATPAVADSGIYQPPTPYFQKYNFDPGCDGVDIKVEGFVRGVESIRVVPGSDMQAFFQTNRYRYGQVWTNTVTGKRFRVKGHALFKEVRAKLVPVEKVPQRLIPEEGLVGPVYRFTAIERGQPQIVKHRGRTVLRDRGLLVFRALFDTLGDSQPGGTTLDEKIVRVRGPHPVLDVDLCDVAEELVG